MEKRKDQKGDPTPLLIPKCNPVQSTSSAKKYLGRPVSTTPPNLQYQTPKIPISGSLTEPKSWIKIQTTPKAQTRSPSHGPSPKSSNSSTHRPPYQPSKPGGSVSVSAIGRLEYHCRVRLGGAICYRSRQPTSLPLLCCIYLT